ncbi:MAG: hypothetical protein EBS29_07175 [Chloroflexia bacterium]|nr:hypothetical protein [Chloroflexia bacterium]
MQMITSRSPFVQRIIVTIVACILVACGQQGASNRVQTTPETAQSNSQSNADSQSNANSQSQPLQIMQLPYDITQMSATWAQRNLDNWPFSRFHPLHLFGEDYDHNGKREATLMFDFLPVGGKVVAPFDGQIREVRDQPEDCDTEMYLLPTQAHQDPMHPSVSLDHVIPAEGFRTPGATFKAGDVIATLGRWQCKEDFARFELMVLAQTDQGPKAECPMRLLDEKIAPTVMAQLKEMMQAWNALKPRIPYDANALQNGICSMPYTQP